MNYSEWVKNILREFLQLSQVKEEENFDHLRFDSSLEHTFLIDFHLRHLLYFIDHRDALFATRLLLADEDSRSLFDRLLLYRLLGQTHVRLPTNTADFWQKRQQVKQFMLGEADEGGVFGKLCYFKIVFLDQPIHVKAWRGNFLNAFLLQQYFYRQGNSPVTPTPGDHVIDASACFGDNALAFAAAVGESGRVYCFDMMPNHLRIINQNLEMNPALVSRIDVLGFGLADASNTLPEARPSESMEDGDVAPDAQIDSAAFPVRSIDDLVEAGRVSRVDFTKMDIEGSELAALCGAERTLRRFTPKLAISLYHKPEDFCDIPAWLNQLGLGYRFYLGHYTIHAGETVLYAIA